MKHGNSTARKRAEKQGTQSTKLYGKQLCGRSRITNGRDLLPSVDGRSIWARRLRDLIGLHAGDLGGSDNLSQAELSLIRRAAALTVELEHMEERFALSEKGADPNDLKTFQMCTNTLRRLHETLGLKRRSRDVTPPDPLEYARRYRREADDAEEVTA